MYFNKIICGNADQVLVELSEANIHFDLILTDPPYNLNKDFGNNSDSLSLPEFLEISQKRIAICKNLLKVHGSIIWFGIHNYIGFLQSIMYSEELYYRRLNIWFYENGFSRTKKTPLTQYEPFLWFSRSDKTWTYNVDDVRIPYKSEKRLKTPVFYNNSKGEKKAWVPNPLGAMRGDVWSYPTLAGKAFAAERTEHPTQKPESLIMDLIKAFCPKNEQGMYSGHILDPFHGSGTLAVCCEKLNKQGHNIQWTAIELEQKWCDIAQSRLDKLK